MSNNTFSSETWLKAAVVGSLWGASEIVLGSFLHNMKVPFSGNMLTAIGIILMVSGHRLWPERGMIIRAGLICAALKTLSPSANILGPMLAIMMQATFMEAALFIGRKTLFGYTLGGGLAMTWNLCYRILSSLVLYGATLIDLYKELVNYFVMQTGWQVQGYILPVLILTGIFFLTGMAAAAAGIYISSSAIHLSPANRIFQVPFKLQPPSETANASRHPDFTTANTDSKIPALILPGFVLMLIAGLYSINRLPLHFAAGILLVFLTGVLIYDSWLVKRFACKRGFWISMAIMLTLSGFLLGRNNGGSGSGFSLIGLQSGCEMMMRAIYVITGFGLLSKVLRRKSVEKWFGTRHMEPFLAAMRISFQTTPLLIESLPGKQAWKKPTRIMATMVASMEDALSYMRQAHEKNAEVRHASGKPHNTQSGNNEAGILLALPQVFVITGNKGTGKTTLLSQVIEILNSRGIEVQGILAPEHLDNGNRDGYYVQDISSGRKLLLCWQVKDERARGRWGDRAVGQWDDVARGHYVFDEKAIAFGEEILLRDMQEGTADVIVIDELGPFELSGRGWAESLDRLHQNWHGSMIWVVRESLVDSILKRWPARNCHVFRTGEATANVIAVQIINNIKP